jgi:predicted neutral ceramidase superfamily lipid hydrolase
MRKINNVIYGVLIGSIFPVIALLVEFLLGTNTYLINRPAVPYFVAIALNLILLRIFLKRDVGKTLRGIMLVTFIVMVIVLLKIHPLR